MEQEDLNKNKERKRKKMEKRDIGKEVHERSNV